jgi:hypothetical protein
MEYDASRETIIRLQMGILFRPHSFGGWGIQLIRSFTRDQSCCYEKGTVLLSPGQANHNLYLLLHGQLKVYLEMLGSGEGVLIEPGECVG